MAAQKEYCFPESLQSIDKPRLGGLGDSQIPPFSVKSGDSFAEFAENTAIAVFFSHSKNPSAKDEGLCRWMEGCPERMLLSGQPFYAPKCCSYRSSSIFLSLPDSMRITEPEMLLLRERSAAKSSPRMMRKSVSSSVVIVADRLCFSMIAISPKNPPAPISFDARA